MTLTGPQAKFEPSGADTASLVEATALYEAGEFDKSEHLLTRLVTRDKSDGGAWYLLGLIAFMRHDYDRADAAFEHALQLNPGNSDAAYYRGEVQLAAGDAESAVRYFRLAVTANPQHRSALTRLGQLGTGDEPAAAMPSPAPAQVEEPRWDPPPLGLMGVHGGGMIARIMRSQQAARPGPGASQRPTSWLQEAIGILIIIFIIAVFVSVATAAGVIVPAIGIVIAVVAFVILRRSYRRARARSG